MAEETEIFWFKMKILDLHPPPALFNFGIPAKI